MALKCNKCYFTFGRFQPPTTGHERNFNAVKRIAGDQMIIEFISHNL